MLIWIILGGVFVGGAIAAATGRVKTSKRRHIVGRSARLLGATFMAIPLAVLAVTFGVAAISGGFLGNAAESARTHGAIVGVVILSVSVLAVAANLQRLSVPIPTGDPSPDFSGISGQAPAADLSFLNQPDNEKPSHE